jgi:hypothetical protein
MALTQSSLDIPFFRPLVGLDKEQTVGLAPRSEPSNYLPFLRRLLRAFPSPPSLLMPDLKKAKALYRSLGP